MLQILNYGQSMTDKETAQSPEIAPIGVDGLLVRFATELDDTVNRAVLAFADAVKSARLKGIDEVSTSLSSVYVRFDPDVVSRTMLASSLHELAASRRWAGSSEELRHRVWHIPVAFGQEFGPQLAETAKLLGLSEEAAIAELLAHPVRVLAIGFAPGQPYCGMLPERWDIPRLGKIAPSVPRGALVVAVRQVILFSNDTPTGWRHIGQTAFRPFRPESADPFPLLPGDHVHFAAVSAEEFDRIERADRDGSGGARLEVGS